MKTKVGKSKLLLIAIVTLLIFVALISYTNQTHSWLSSSNSIGFEVNVDGINIDINQGAREINDTGYIYLNTEVIRAGETYLNTESTYVTVTNNEEGDGYFMRCKAIVNADGEYYSINNLFTSGFKAKTEDDGWLYLLDASNNQIQMSANQTLVLMQNLIFPQSFMDNIQGSHVKLYLFVQGSATGVFN